MASPFPNVWHLRTVAESSSKSCYICYKPTTGVLITPENKDFFYVCKTHLKDKGFASPVVDEKAEAEKKKKEALDSEIEKIKKEYEEKQKARKKKKDDKDQKSDQNGDKAEKERDEKIKAAENAAKPATPTVDDGPRVFTLQRNFYQMRIDRIRNAEMAKRNQQRINNPSFFPTVPKGDIA